MHACPFVSLSIAAPILASIFFVAAAAPAAACDAAAAGYMW